MRANFYDNMAEVTEEKVNTGTDIQEKLGKAELYFDQNKKNIGIVAAVVAVLVGGIAAYKMWWLPEQDAEAQNQMYKAQQYFDKDSLKIAVNGGPAVTGLTEIADNYGGTKAANLSEYMIGVSMLQQGQYEAAIEHLSNFDGGDVMLSSVATGAIGDAHMELNHTDEAIKYYLKAADQVTNTFTAPIYLKKAAMAYEEKGAYQEALNLYQRIQQEFPKSNEAREIERYISRVKQLGNL